METILESSEPRFFPASLMVFSALAYVAVVNANQDKCSAYQAAHSKSLSGLHKN